jgi:hypothetical protein
MIDWPKLDELKQRLDITSDDFDGEDLSDGESTRLQRLLEAAIAETKVRVGDWSETTDVPDAAIAQSALELAVEYAMREPDPGRPVTRSVQLLYGHRRRFGVA